MCAHPGYLATVHGTLPFLTELDGSPIPAPQQARHVAAACCSSPLLALAGERRVLVQQPACSCMLVHARVVVSMSMLASVCGSWDALLRLRVCAHVCMRAHMWACVRACAGVCQCSSWAALV